MGGEKSNFCHPEKQFNRAFFYFGQRKREMNNIYIKYFIKYKNDFPAFKKMN